MTREERLEKWAKRRRAKRIAFIKKCVLIGMAVLCVAGGVIMLSSRSKASDETGKKKMYKAIHVESGDTLWSIAEDNLYGFDSVSEYIEEVAFINHIKHTNRIRTGEMLVIPYYVDEDIDVE